MKFRIYPYKIGSTSAKKLAQGLNALRVRPDGYYHPRQDHLIINWGNSQDPQWITNSEVRHFKNFPDNVAIAANKLKTFQVLKQANVPIPEWTQSPETADNWIQEGNKVYGRQTLTGHSGQGIHILTEELRIPRDIYPLYTKDTKTTHEFRIHVGNNGNSIIDMTQKKKRNGYEGGISGIRNHINGWIFARQDIIVPDCVQIAAKDAIKALSLNFGAVDIGYKEDTNKVFVYEVNTAPGLEGTTLEKYINYFKEYLE